MLLLIKFYLPKISIHHIAPIEPGGHVRLQLDVVTHLRTSIAPWVFPDFFTIRPLSNIWEDWLHVVLFKFLQQLNRLFFSTSGQDSYILRIYVLPLFCIFNVLWTILWEDLGNGLYPTLCTGIQKTINVSSTSVPLLVRILENFGWSAKGGKAYKRFLRFANAVTRFGPKVQIPFVKEFQDYEWMFL